MPRAEMILMLGYPRRAGDSQIQSISRERLGPFVPRLPRSQWRCAAGCVWLAGEIVRVLTDLRLIGRGPSNRGERLNADARFDREHQLS